MPEPFSIGVSYSWDDDAHKAWVKALATKLRNDGLDVGLDQWHLDLGDRLPAFMERLVRDSRHVLIVGTQGYKDRFDGRKGGTGYEGHIISGSLLSGSNIEKFIPVLRSGDWTTSVPTALTAVLGVDLRGNPYSEDEYRKLVRKLHGVTGQAPPIGPPPEWLRAPTAPESSDEPIPQKDDGIGYYREVIVSSLTPIERTPAQLFDAGQMAVLSEVAWPLSLYWYRHTGGDGFVKREPVSNGVKANYQQHDLLVDRIEQFEAINPGKVTIRETQEFPSRHRDGGFPYDTAIGTTAEALRFSAQFFRALGLGDNNEIVVEFSWHGIKDRFITADTVRIEPAYTRMRSHTDSISSRILQFRLADGERLLAENVHKLLEVLFNQFDLFTPKPAIYEKVLEHWKKIAV